MRHITAILTMLISILITTHSQATTLLVNNFDNSILSGSFSFGSTRMGQSCCPYTIDPNFIEQSATAFTLNSTSKLERLELVMLQTGGNIDSFRLLLTRSSSTNPGGSNSSIGNQAPDLDQVIESWLFEDQLSQERTIVTFDSVIFPILPAGELLWLVLTPGKETLTAGDIIDIGWVAGNQFDPLLPAFGRRNNFSGGSIDDIVWDTGTTNVNNLTYSTRVIGTPVLPVTIDIKPNKFPNKINLRSHGVIAVAILTTDASDNTVHFDATTVDPTTVYFGATGTEAMSAQNALEDIDDDGDIDLIFHFETGDTGIHCGDNHAVLTGHTYDGEIIEGSDLIKTIGCK